MTNDLINLIYNEIDTLLAVNDDNICRSNYPAKYVRDLIEQHKEGLLKETPVETTNDQTTPHKCPVLCYR